MADDRYPAPEQRSNQPQTSRTGYYRAAGEPHPLLSRQAQRQDVRRLRRHRRLYRLRRQPGPGLLPRRDVHERRLDPAVLFHRRLVTPTKPRALERVDSEEQQFWQGVRASPARAARDIRSRFKDIDRRLADIESYVTTENRSLAREIEQLR